MRVLGLTKGRFWEGRQDFIFGAALWLAIAPANLANLARADETPLGKPVPITLRAGHVWIDGTLNGQPAHFILDSGAGAMLVTPEAAARCGLSVEKSKTIVQGAIAVGVQQTVAASVGVGAAQLHDQACFVAPVPEQLAGCDGFLGYPFLQKFVATIDYENRLCGLSSGDAPALASPAPAADAPKGTWLPVDFQESIPVIEGAVDGLPVRLRIDTGDDGAAMLTGPFVLAHHLREKFTPRLTTITGRGLGGLTKGDIVRVPTLTLGASTAPGATITLHRVITELSWQNAGGFYGKTFGGQIGAEVLEHFTVTFDYAHKRVRFAPNGKFDAPFAYNRAGMNIDEQKGRFTVVDVIPDTPAAEAGFVSGDTIVSVDSVPAAQITAVGFHDMLRRPVGTKLKVVRQRPGTVLVEATVVLRDLL